MLFCFFFTDPATTEIYTLSLHDALPISLIFICAVYLQVLFLTDLGRGLLPVGHGRTGSDTVGMVVTVKVVTYVFVHGNNVD